MKSSSCFVVAAAFVLALSPLTMPQAAPRSLVLDPETKAMERAGWTYIGISDGALIYMKDAIPGSSGEVRRVLTAYESLTEQAEDGFTFRSVQKLSEYDCAKGRSRVMQETYFKEPLLKGDIWTRDRDLDPKWSERIGGSIGMMRIVFACRDRPLA